MMDPLWSETCWSAFKYFIILIVSTIYVIVHKLDNIYMLMMHGANVKIIS